MRKSTLTPFLVILPLVLFVCLYYALFYLFVENGGALRRGGVLLLSLAIGLAALLIIERMVVYRTRGSLTKIWIAEIIGILVIAGFYYNRQSSFYYKVSDKAKWFVVIESEEDTHLKSSYAFPFSRVVHIDSNSVVQVSRKDIGGKRQAVRPSGYKWRGYTWRSRKVTVNGRRVDLAIYCQPRTELTATDYQQMETYLLQEVKQ